MTSGQHQTATIEWHESGAPVSHMFNDPYFSIKNGLAETRHVFLDGNQLSTRLKPGFHIAELGFGCGLNLLATWQLCRSLGNSFPANYTSFEAFPIKARDMETALNEFPELADFAASLLPLWAAGETKFLLDGLNVEIVLGDANNALPNWRGKADAWFLDGFSPAKNPELWRSELMTEVANHTKPGGTFSTYSAAGHIRRSLTDAGFEVTRIKGYGSKRHMSVGRLREHNEPE